MRASNIGGRGADHEGSINSDLRSRKFNYNSKLVQKRNNFLKL